MTDTFALLSTSLADGCALLAAAESGWKRSIPHCPEWDAEGLVRHTGAIFVWMAAVEVTRERVSFRTLTSPPDDRVELSSWFVSALNLVIDVLGSADPESETWTFSSTGNRRVGWWRRRLAVEVAIHRYDAEYAITVEGGPVPAPLNGNVAAAGVEEFMVEFLPGLLAGEAAEGLEGTLHLHATDGPLEWWVDMADARAARPEHDRADAAVKGTRSDLLLWLTNRVPLGSLEVVGDPQIAESWARLRR